MILFSHCMLQTKEAESNTELEKICLILISY